LYSPYDYFPVLLGLALGIVFAVFFYRVGEIEYEKGNVFCLASLAITLIVSFWLHHGAMGVVMAQLLLFAGMWIFNVRRSKLK
jgi:Ca2+/Na+ antiporter